MSGETILKSSIFGGYKKKDVLQYVDSLLDENDRKIHRMEDRISFLTKENNRMRAQLNAGEDRITGIPGASHPAAPVSVAEQELTKDRKPITAAGREDVSDEQPMRLAQGTYLVSKGKVIDLPDPSPIYRTKGADDPLKFSTVADAEELLRTRAAMNETAEIASQVAASSTQASSMANYRMRAHVPDNAELTDDVAALKAELTDTRNQLEKERQEKQVLAGKLEFSSDLLIRLYQR